ncbi:MAG: chemotaxis protein CheW [Alphaproteobacteria bacterium]
MPASSAIDTTVGGSGGRRSLHILTLGLQGEVFAVETARVHEVLELSHVTEVPNSRSFVRGLINVRGKVVPVADLRRRFGMEVVEFTLDTRIVVMDIHLDGETIQVGAVADRVYGVTEVAAASMEDAPRIGMKWRAEFVQAIGKQEGTFIIILDIDRVFATDEAAYLGAQGDGVASQNQEGTG